MILAPGSGYSQSNRHLSSSTSVPAPVAITANEIQNCIDNPDVFSRAAKAAKYLRLDQVIRLCKHAKKKQILHYIVAIKRRTMLIDGTASTPAQTQMISFFLESQLKLAAS